MYVYITWAFLVTVNMHKAVKTKSITQLILEQLLFCNSTGDFLLRLHLAQTVTQLVQLSHLTRIGGNMQIETVNRAALK